MTQNDFNSVLRITPHGGVGEIGSNMTIFEIEDEYLVIDYGILFPYEDFFDINYLIVNTDNLDPNKKLTLFVTHGHEDHIGAIPHLVKKFPKIQIHAPAFAASLIRSKLERRKISCRINVYSEDDIIDFGDFEIHPVHVTHSIPHTFGVIVKDKKDMLSILFISDFKYDLNPLYEKPFNIEKIKKLFNNSKRKIAMLDSTNILVDGKTISESDLVDDLEHLLSKNKRSFVTLFSSNIFRVKTILEIAKKHGKVIVPVGRSITHYLEAANENGLVDLEKEPIKDLSELNNYEESKIIGLLTGCQGDFLGALRRIASREHKEFKLQVGDQVIFSSKPIPGNSKKISRIYNEITAQGAEVITDKDYKIHASGHPGQTDLKELLSELTPTDYIPIHGETYFLKKHFDFIQDNYSFIPHLLHNFSSIHINHNYDLSFTEVEETLPEIIHGQDLVLEREKISERRKMACNGTIFISLNLKGKKISVETKGLPVFVENYASQFQDILKNCAFNDNKNKPSDVVAEKTRIKCRQIYSNILGYKPITIVHAL